MTNDKRYWFPAKPPGYGWGWGLPLTWQGWTVYLLFFVLLISASIFVLPGHPFMFFACVAAFCGGLIGICFWKGESPNAPPRRKPD